MPRQRKWPPQVYAHPSGQDRIAITLKDGRRKFYWLGPTGTPEARQNYLKIVAELEAGPGKIPPASPHLLVGQLVAPYLVDAKKRHTAKQYGRIKLAIIPVLKLHMETRLEQFGPVALEEVQQHMVKLG